MVALGLILLAAQAAAGGEGAPRAVAVVPAAWKEEMAPWLELRRRDFQVELLVLEEELARGRGADAPERLKRRLWERWKAEGLDYVLLVGDADTLPVRFMVLDRRTEAAFDTAFYPSDLYYADLAEEDGSFEDWNDWSEGHHAGWFGEVRGETDKSGPIDRDGVHYLPEAAVGRWPVSNREELRAVLGKTLAWEERRPEATLFLAHAAGWVDARPRLDLLSAAWRTAGWEVETALYGRTEPDPETTLGALRAGPALAIHVGHGTATGWQGCLRPGDVPVLRAAPPAVYLSVGCSTAHWCVEPPYQPYLDVDGILHAGTNAGEVFTEPPPAPAPLQPGRLDESGLGERLLLLEEGGAVAYLGCCTGAQPCALSLLDGFAVALADPGVTRLGAAWNRALEHYVAAEELRGLEPDEGWYPPSIFFQGMKFLLLGDPCLSLPLRDRRGA